jgi:hypothetical protein
VPRCGEEAGQPQEVTPASPERDEVDVGEAGDRLPLWLAKEAVRHGELRLAAQQSNLAAMETRATAIFGWSIPTILALGAAALSSRFTGAAVGAAVCLAGSAIHCAVALWPQKWGHPGHNPNVLLDMQLSSELEVLEAVAGGYASTARLNDDRLIRFGAWLRTAWVLFIAAPVAGLVGVLMATITWVRSLRGRCPFAAVIAMDSEHGLAGSPAGRTAVHHANLSRARRPLPFRAVSASRNVSALSCACAWRRACSAACSAAASCACRAAIRCPGRLLIGIGGRLTSEFAGLRRFQGRHPDIGLPKGTRVVAHV